MSTPVPTALRRLAYAGACALFVAILFAHGGPNPAEVDAKAVTEPTTALTHGDLRAAERATTVPNPPGYPLLTAPLVALARPWVGSPTWCSDKPLPAVLREAPGAAFFEAIIGPCSGPGSTATSRARPHWYQSQAVLAVLAWLALVAGAVHLLRTARGGRDRAELLLVVALALLPAAADTIVESFHPQDLLSVAGACLGLSYALRRRWILCGLAFAAACLCKQFALLPLLATLAAVPGWRPRAVVAGTFVLVVAVVLLPFLLVDSTDALHALTGTYVVGAGVVKAPTVLGQLAIAEQLKLEIARDGPVLTAGAMVLVAAWRAGNRLLAPVPLIALALAVLALRLVFEVSILNYYFLAVGTFLLLLDLAVGRPPLWAIGWIVTTRYVLAPAAGHLPAWVTASAFLALSVLPIALGLARIPGLLGRAGAEQPEYLGATPRPLT